MYTQKKKMPPKKKTAPKKKNVTGGFLPLLMTGGLMGLAALMKATGGARTGGNVTGGRRKR